MWTLFRISVVTVTLIFLQLSPEFCRARDVNEYDNAFYRDNGYFKLCNVSGALENERNYFLAAEHCPHGVWLSEPELSQITQFHDGCVCLNGVWAISHSSCHEDYSIVNGAGGQCFKFNRQTQKLSFLGNPSDIYEAADYISIENGYSFRRIPSGFIIPQTHHESSRTIVKVQYGRRTYLHLEVETDDGLDTRGQSSEPFCFESDEDSEMLVTALVYKLDANVKSIQFKHDCQLSSSGSTEKFKENIKTLKIFPGEMAHIKSGHLSQDDYSCSRKCMDWEATPYSGTYPDFDDDVKGDILVRKKRQAKEIKIDLAKTSGAAPAPSNTGGTKKAQGTDYGTGDDGDDGDDFKVVIVDDTSGNKSKPIGPGPAPGPGLVQLTTERSLSDKITELIGDDKEGGDFEPLKLDREFTAEEKDQTVNIANMRVVRQELNWLLDGIRPPIITSPNWKLMKKLKEIFTTACPKVEAPKFLANAMMRLFRLFYINSRDFYPNGHLIDDKAQLERVDKALDNCLADTTEIAFNYTAALDPKFPKCRNVSEDIEDNGVTSTTTVFFCRCQDKLFNVNFSYALNTSAPAEVMKLYTGLNLTLSKELRFVMANAEKPGTFYDFPTETLWKMISFGHYYCAKYFRDKPADHSALLTRLEDFFNEDIVYRWTRPGSNSNKVWQFLYSAFDLKKFANAMDACVATAKSVSEYPQWISRPTFDLLRRKKRSTESTHIWNGSAFCMKNALDPVGKLESSSNQNKCDN